MWGFQGFSVDFFFPFFFSAWVRLVCSTEFATQFPRGVMDTSAHEFFSFPAAKIFGFFGLSHDWVLSGIVHWFGGSSGGYWCLCYSVMAFTAQVCVLASVCECESVCARVCVCVCVSVRVCLFACVWYVGASVMQCPVLLLILLFFCISCSSMWCTICLTLCCLLSLPSLSFPGLVLSSLSPFCVSLPSPVWQ